ncbi:MAG: hypothetical protein ACI4IF_03005 [Acutalibacteraceae bacterium]
MKTHIINDANYDIITIGYKSDLIKLSKGNEIVLETSDNEIDFTVSIPKKNYVILSPLFLFAAFSDNDVISTIYCNANVNVKSNSDSYIRLKDIESRDESNFIYESVYSVDNNVNISYSITNCEGEKKCKFYTSFITSLLPLSLMLIVYAIISGEGFALVSSLLITVVISIPKMKKRKRIKQAFRDSNYANDRIKKTVDKIYNNTLGIPEDKIGKACYEFLDRKNNKKNR